MALPNVGARACIDKPEVILTYRYRLLPSKSQHRALERLCEDQRILYNAALQERIDCYRKTGKSITYIDQCNSLTACRRDLPEMAALPSRVQRWTLKRLDDAFKAFFRRIKARDGKPGFPRFRGKDRWESFGFTEFAGIRFDGKRLRWAGLPGGMRVHIHRPLPDDADIRSCVFRRSGRIWHVCLQLKLPAVAGGVADNETECGERRPDHLACARESLPLDLVSPERQFPDHLACARESLPPIGIDLGVKVFAYCSDGTIIKNPRFRQKWHREMRRRARALARCKRGSNRRRKVRERLTRLHRKIANSRSTWLHQQSAALTNRADLIVAEDLNVKGLTRSAKGTLDKPGSNVRAKSGLNRSITDASWSMFLAMVAYKAERAGGRFVTVNPRNTSQRCSGCNELIPKSLAVRTHSCPHCGLVIDRDWNASINILRAGLSAGWAT